MTLEPLVGGYLQLSAWLAAFWCAVLAYRFSAGASAAAERYVAGLVLGAWFAQCGRALMDPLALLDEPLSLLNPQNGVSVLFVPLGFLVVASWRTSPHERAAFLARALPTLPLAFAVARLGCVAAGCCGGTSTSVPWAIPSAGGEGRVHPSPVYEIALLVLLHALVRRAPVRGRAALVLGGLGAIRLALEPLRAHSAAIDAPISAAWVALAWVAYAVWMGTASGVPPAQRVDAAA